MNNRCRRSQGIQGQDTSVVTLNDLMPGESGIVSELRSPDGIQQRLMDMGIIEGARVQMIRPAPLNNPVEIRVFGALLALRRQEADMILIHRCGEQQHERKTHRHRAGRKS